MEYTQSILGAISGIVLTLLTAFFTTKGKYWADADSLPKLTKELEHIKGEVSVLTNKQNILFHEQKEAIYHFFSAYAKWYDMLDAFIVQDYNHRNYKDLEDHLERKFAEVYHKEVQVGLIRMMLFVNNDALVNEALNLCNETQMIKEKVMDIADELYLILQDDYDYVREKNISYEEVYEEIFIVERNLPEQKAKKKELSDRFLKEINPIDNKVDKLHRMFMNNCRKYILS